MNKVLEKHEDPREALDYSAVKQTELIQRLRREIVEVVASKKRLEMLSKMLKKHSPTLKTRLRPSMRKSPRTSEQTDSPQYNISP